MARKKKKLIIGLAIGLVVILIVVLNLVRSSEKALNVQAEEVKRGRIVSTVSATGKIQPETEVDISANVSGKIVQLGVQEGDAVQKGQFLVQLDRNRYQAMVDQAQAQLTSAEARLLEAEAEYRRVKQLFDARLSSEADLEAIKARRDVEQANYDASKAYLDKAQDDLSKTVILAPMSGTVSQLNSEVGEVVLGTEQFSGTVIMTIADLSRMEVEADVDETDIVDVSIGQPAKIEVDAIPDTALMGQVTEIASTAYTLGRGTQEEVTNFKVKVAIGDKMPNLRPGMSATVDIETDSFQDALYVPIQSVVMRNPKPPEEEGKKTGGSKKGKDEPTEKASGEKKRDSSAATEEPSPSDTSQAKLADSSQTSSSEEDEKEKLIEVVFLVKDQTAVMVPVETGISSDTDTQILSGLEKGQMVITGSYRALRDLRDGQKVKVEKSGEKKDKDKGNGDAD